MNKVIALAAALLAGLGVHHAHGQAYPSKPVRLVVTISAGSTADILARVVAEPVSKRLGQPVVVENRPGAGGNVAGDYVAKQAPDGHILLLATISSHGINPNMYGAKMPYDAMADFAHIIALASVPNLLIANPRLPVESVADFVRLARSKPGEFAFSSGGNGTSHHLAAELLNAMAGIKTVHVPYRGTPEGVTSVMRGDAAIMFPNAPNAEAQVKDGRVKALAVTSAKRIASLPNVPTMIESGFPGFEVIGWYGLVAPAGTPGPVVKRLNAEFQTALEQQSVREALAKQGFEIMGGSPEEFRRFNQAEIDKWAKVVEKSGAKVE
ncbi:MAG TPA: tripartite tricarboxylate transporter substrate binding protein [Burkholderiales bacterium]|nr:tripartite tricarboxylate transporter substrate binding protein [Burkholderiales bacterium]